MQGSTHVDEQTSACVRLRKIDSEKSVTFEKTECATRVLYFISRIFQMKCATDVNDFFSLEK